MNQLHLRREFYLMLSEAYKHPTAPFITEQPALVDFTRQACLELGYDLPAALYENWPQLLPDLQAATADYQQSFLLPIETRIVPVESIYRRWTQDAGAELPFSAEKGLLMSDHALHVKALYDAYGISIPAEYQSAPDHICLELEFAAFLLELNELEQHSLFLAEHLNWLDELVADAEKQEIPSYYQQIVKLTAQFLSLELRR